MDAGGRVTHGAVAEGRGEGRSVVRRWLIFIFRGWCIAMCVRCTSIPGSRPTAPSCRQRCLSVTELPDQLADYLIIVGLVV
jgi:hypothetical protein